MLLGEHLSDRLSTLDPTNLIRETSGNAPDLDATALVAARLFRVPIALVTLVDRSTVWIRGCHGLSADRAARRDAFCDETVQLAPGGVFVVLDAREDPRFAASSLVLGPPHIRFYAGVQIAVEGHVVGTLCIMDRMARAAFEPTEVEELQNLAIVAGAQLGFYRSRAVRDVEASERGRVEALLNQREAEFQSISKVQKIAETVGSFGHFHVDLAAWAIGWSEGIARIFDRPLPASKMVDLDLYISFFHPDDARWIRRRIKEALAGNITQKGPHHARGRVIRPDGEIRDVIVEGFLELNPANELVSLHGILLDVTDLNRSERQSRERSELLRTTLESMDQGLLMLGPDQRVRIHNRRARDLLDLPEDLLFDGAPFDAIRRHQIAIGEFEHVSDDYRAFVAAGGLEREPLTHERRRPDGTVLEVRAVPLADGSVVRTYTDITQRRSIERAAQESARQFRLLAETTTDVIIWSDLDSTRRYVSPASKRVLGYDPEDLVGTRPIAFTHPDDVEAYSRLLDDLSHTRIEHGTSRQRYRRKDGAWVWVEVSFSLTRDASGTATGYVASLRDISDRKAAEDALRFSQEQLALALDSGSDGLFDLDVATGELRHSGRWLSIVGFDEGEVEPTLTAWSALTHPDDVSRYDASLDEHLKGVNPEYKCEYRVRKKTGDYVWTCARGKVVARNPDGRASRMVGTLIDITARKEAEELVAHMAHHDALTGLPNRTLFRQRLDHELIDAVSNQSVFGVLACDLDGFKAVNDTFGHSAGDQILRTVADRLKSIVRTNDTVARLGGDEFAIILGSLEADQGACSVAQRMIHAVQHPIQVEGQAISIGMSVGIAIGLEDGTTADNLFRSADIALYQAKAEGRNTYRFFKTGMDAVLAQRNALAHDMRNAVRQNSFELRYQPIVTINSGMIAGFEALLRWRDPVRGDISPSDFIPIAEQTGLIVPLGEWALLEACRTAAAWPRQVRIAVNVSTVQFHRPDNLQRSVLHALAISGLSSDRLELEITESVLMHDAESVIACLHGLRDIGVRISLDDFGTGFSSLNYLRRFPFSKIKIDQSFVREIADPGTVAIVRAVVGLGTRVQADITAEGVETVDQLAHVRREGCTEAQGYLFSRPLSGQDAADLLKTRRRLQVAA